MTRQHPNITFESLSGDDRPQRQSPSVPVAVAVQFTPDALPSRVLRGGAAGTQSQPARASRVQRADRPAVAYESVAQANPPAMAGNEYRFGSRLPRPDPLGSFLKRSKLTQALVDIAALAFGVFLSFVVLAALFGAGFALLIFFL